jgi:hypothetical protein
VHFFAFAPGAPGGLQSELVVVRSTLIASLDASACEEHPVDDQRPGLLLRAMTTATQYRPRGRCPAAHEEARQPPKSAIAKGQRDPPEIRPRLIPGKKACLIGLAQRVGRQPMPRPTTQEDIKPTDRLQVSRRIRVETNPHALRPVMFSPKGFFLETVGAAGFEPVFRPSLLRSCGGGVACVGPKHRCRFVSSWWRAASTEKSPAPRNPRKWAQSIGKNRRDKIGTTGHALVTLR